MSIELPDELLEKMWNEINWAAAEKKLADLQEKLSILMPCISDGEASISASGSAR